MCVRCYTVSTYIFSQISIGAQHILSNPKFMPQPLYPFCLFLSLCLFLSPLFVPGSFRSSKTGLISHHLLSWRVAITELLLPFFHWPLPAGRIAPCLPVPVFLFTSLSPPSGQPQQPGLFSRRLTLLPFLRSASHPWAKTRRKDLGLFSLEKKWLI